MLHGMPEREDFRFLENLFPFVVAFIDQGTRHESIAAMTKASV